MIASSSVTDITGHRVIWWASFICLQRKKNLSLPWWLLRNEGLPALP